MKERAAKLGFVLAALAAALVFLGCASTARQNTVLVSGTGTVRAQPDTVQMVISMRYTARTTRQAQAEVTGMVRQALEILRDSGVEERNIGTAMLRFFPEYEWGPQGRNFLGQRAEQTIAFSIDDIGEGGASASPSDIIDRLIGINGIELQGMHFSVRDAEELHYRARELAYREALEKARQYARLSGQRIVRTLSVVEGGLPPVAARQRAGIPQAVAMEADWAVMGGTVLPAGEMEITARISVEFLMR